MNGYLPEDSSKDDNCREFIRMSEVTASLQKWGFNRKERRWPDCKGLQLKNRVGGHAQGTETAFT